MSIVITILWVAAISALLLYLTGCLELTRDQQIDDGRFSVKADCEKNTVEVELDLDRKNDAKGAGVKR